MKEELKHPKIIVEKSQHYRTIIVSGVFGGHRPGFFEAVIYTDELVADEALEHPMPKANKIYIKRTVQCRLLMNPFQAKSFAQWLVNHIKEYEKEFGEIKLPKQPSTEKTPSYIA